MRRITVLLAIILTAVPLGGCMDYRGLDEMSIVTGIAVDRDKNNPEMYNFCYEILRATPGDKEKVINTEILEASGHTISQATEVTNRMSTSEMYFGNTEVLIVAEEVARDSGILWLMEELMRDYAVRETLMIVIARDSGARDLIKISPQTSDVRSYSISQSLEWGDTTTYASYRLKIYEVYNYLKCPSDISIMLPAFSVSRESPEAVPEIDGLSVFNKDRLVGFMDESQVVDALFILQPPQRGSFFFTHGNSAPAMASFDVEKTSSSRSYRYENGRLTFKVDLSVIVNLQSLPVSLLPLDEALIKALEESAGRSLEGRIESLFREMASVYEADIFGLSRAIYQKNPNQWKELKAQWPALLKNASIEVNASFSVRNTGVLKEF